MKRTILIIVALACLGAAATARADLTIEMRQNGVTQQLFLKDHMFSSAATAGPVIFRADKQRLWIVDTAAKSYSELTKQDVVDMGRQIEGALGQMREQLKNLPPEQRAMMEKMMADRLPKQADNSRVVKATGERKVINGFDCAGYLATHADKSTTEIWAADPAKVGIDPAELAVLGEFADFLKSMLGAVGLDAMRDLTKDFAKPGPSDVPGFPVLTVHRDAAGKETMRAELAGIGHGALAADRFEVPAGFRKTAMPGVPARGDD